MSQGNGTASAQHGFQQNQSPPRRGYICLNVVPRSASHAHTCIVSSRWCEGMKDRCLCARSSWQLAAGLLMSLGGSGDGRQSGFITKTGGTCRRRCDCDGSVPLLHIPREILQNASACCTLEASPCIHSLPCSSVFCARTASLHLLLTE